MKLFHAVTKMTQLTKTLICPVGFLRFHIINPNSFQPTDFSPFSVQAIRLSSYPYLPNKVVPGYKLSEVEQCSQQGAKMLQEKKWDSAYIAYQQRLKLVIAEYGDQHTATRQAREDLGSSLLILGRFREAEEIFSTPVMTVEQDHWCAYRTTNATLDFMLGEHRSAYQQFQQQFLLLNTPFHPLAYLQKYGLSIVANNLGAIASQLELPEEADYFYKIAKKTSENIRRYPIFTEVVNLNDTHGDRGFSLSPS